MTYDEKMRMLKKKYDHISEASRRGDKINLKDVSALEQSQLVKWTITNIRQKKNGK